MMFEAELIYFVILNAALIVFALLRSNNIVMMTLLSSSFSLFSVILYVLLDAPDVAMTESSISVLSLLFAVYAIRSSCKDYLVIDDFKPIIFMACMLLAVGLIYMAQDLPIFGSPDFNQYYLRESQRDIGINSVVASILASYRGYDTMLETLVILIAGLSVLLISGEFKLIVKRSDKLITVMTRMILPFILLFALYIQFHGEISPGGGFQAGAIIATFIITYMIICDNDATKTLIRKEVIKNIAVTGVGIYFFIGMIGLFNGDAFLSYNNFLSQAGGIMLVELGVAICVAASMLLIYKGMVNATSKSL